MTYEISEQELDGQIIYHWTIRDSDGNELLHSAYHTYRVACEQEALERLQQVREMGWAE